MTIKEKLLKEINKLPEKRINEIYKLLSKVKKNKQRIRKLKTYELGGNSII